MPKKNTISANNRKIGLMALLILLISSITLVIINNQRNYRSTVIKTHADEEVTPTPTPGKSCTTYPSSDTAPSCEFYEKCSENFCQYNQNWGEDVTPLQVLAIYNRLKTDLGIDFSFLFDKDRINSLSNGMALARIKFDDACFSATSRVMDENGKFICNLDGLDDPKIQKTLDDMKLPAILKGLYPDLSDENIALLERKLREANLKSTLGKTPLELVFLEIDLMTIPYFYKDIGQLGIKTLTSGAKELLPKFLGILQSGKQFFFDKEGIKALEQLSSHSVNHNLDFIAQMQAHLRNVKPSFIFKNTKGELVPLWKPMDVLSSEWMVQVDDVLSVIRPITYERLGFKNPWSFIYFTDDISRFVKQSASLAAYLPSLNIMVVDIKAIPLGPLKMVGIINHEDIHFILNNKGIATSIFKLRGFFSDNRYLLNLRAFNEGLIEYLNRYIIQLSGLPINSNAYQRQVEAVNHLLGDGKYVQIIIDAIRTGDFKYFLNSYRWSPDTLFKWIIGNLQPVSHLHQKSNLSLNKIFNLFQAHAASEDTDYSDPNYEDKIKPNLSFEYKEQADATAINKSAYSLVGEIDRIMTENNLSEFLIEDEDALKSLVLAGSILNELNSKQYVTIQDIKNTSDELDNITVEEYNPKEYEEKLPPIGNSDIPIPTDISIDNASDNQTTTESTPTPTISQDEAVPSDTPAIESENKETIIGNCNDPAGSWTCEWPDKLWKNCLDTAPGNQSLFNDTYCDGELMWKYQAAQAHGGDGSECGGIQQNSKSDECGK